MSGTYPDRLEQTVSTVVDPRQAAYETVTTMIQELRALAELQAESAEGKNDFLVKLMAGILNAETLEDMFTAQSPDNGGMIASKNFIDRPFKLSVGDIVWKLSDEKYRKNNSGLPFYAILQQVVEVETGEEHTIDAGGLTVVTTLFKMVKHGWLDTPKILKFVGTESSNGTFLTLALVTPPQSGNGKGKRT
jgi:hypothetical protein